MTPVNQLGYGIAGLNFLLELNKHHKVSFFPIGQVEAHPEVHPILSETHKNATMFNVDAPCLRIWHQHDMSQRVGRGKMFGMPIFELDTFSELEKHHLNTLDTVLVNSDWAAGVIESNIGKKASVVPLGVDNSIFTPQPIEDKKDNTTRFLNMGKWEVRKGHDVLVDIFTKSFAPHDDVELWLCCHNPFYSAEENKEWEDYYLNSPYGYKIKIVPRLESQEDVAKVMNSVDCGIFPTRGEGWNLEALEMMACGKHVITTNYSGHTQFCNENNSYLINTPRLETAFDGKWFTGQGRWANIGQDEIHSFSLAMRDIYKKKNSGSDMVNKKGLETAQEFSWENSTKKLVEVING